MTFLDIVVGILVGWVAYLITGQGFKMNPPWPTVIGILIGIVVAYAGLKALGITVG